MVGRTISRYKITEKLGEGGMGVVYKARDMDLDRSVALKFLPAHLISDSNIRKRFLREAKAAASISHPNICTVYEIGEADGSAFISMAYLDGRELSEEIEEGPIAVDRAVDLATQFADGLAEAHRAGMVHRDIKPANLFVGTNGRGIILDFGIAQLANAQTKLTKEGAVFGTYAYMSPEQALAQKVDARTDVWALGCVLYEMLSGQRPFRAEYQPALVYSIINEKPEPLTEACENVPPGLAAIISSCLSKDPADRPENGAELAARLRSPNELATAASSFGASFKLPSIKRAWLATGAALLSVAAALLFWTSAGGNDAPVSPGAKHVAVIPFQTGQEDLKVFAGGLTEAVTHRLSQYEGRDDALLVTPASETRRQDVTTAADARAKFGATHAVEGALSGEGDRLRLVLSVIDTNSMRASASAIIEANRDEALSLQDETVANIVSALELGVKPEYAAELNTLNPVEPAAYEFYIQGLGYLQRNDRLDDIDNAIGLFEHALSLDPEYARAYAGLGDAYLQKFRRTSDSQWIDSAQASAEKALQLENQLPEAHTTMGRVLIETGRSEDAVSEFTRALDLGQRSGMAYEGLAEAYAQLGQTDRAEAAYRSMLSRRRNDWRAYHQLALFYKRQGDLPGAIREYQHVIALTPDNAMAYSNLGGFYYIAGQFAEAREMWEKSRSIEPTRAALTNLAQLQMNDEQYEQALETYLQVIELDPNNYRAWTNVGVAYGRVGLSSEATQARWNSIRLAKDLLARNPQHIGALTFLAHEFAVDRDREKSLDLLERAERIAGDDPGAWVGLAQAYAELGRNEKARVCLQKALDLGYSIEALRQKQGLQPVLEKWNFETELP